MLGDFALQGLDRRKINDPPIEAHLKSNSTDPCHMKIVAGGDRGKSRADDDNFRNQVSYGATI